MNLISIGWAIILANANELAIMLLDQLYRFSRVFRAIVADRLGYLAIAIDRCGIGQIGYATVHRAQDQEH
jgi:hypothetical protein